MGLEWFRYYTAWNTFANKKRYDVPTTPWKMLRVNPLDVEFFSVISMKWGLGRVRGGEWDDKSNLTLLSEIAAYSGFRQRFEDGADWEETDYYEMAKDRINEHGEYRGSESIEEFEQTNCHEIDELFENIRQEGFRPNKGTVYTNPEDADYIHDLEPMVLIGRSGEIYWTEGFHRLVIAQLLGVEEIPVYVLRRHDEWQRIREKIHTTPISNLSSRIKAHIDHPDIENALF
ncbi:hypothetical protein V5735_22725 (plasmid) [Haladaptatus sp. SPP-AMP-3]|uniref:hypothetical protein n=1 Tax=Haladaptatus sp. SPP-AMP-3 TaxID=3121295 RepID=UPI003C2B154B